MSNTLLPCPFCGGAKLEVSNKTTTISYVRKRHVAVYCKKCNTYGPRIIADETGYPEFCTEEAKQEAIAAWNRRAQPENEPLTLDELRQMDGEPVWIVTLDGTADPIWEIIVSAGEHGIDLICVLNGVETSDYADFDLYNDTWLAYRNKPVKEEHNEAD